VHVKRITATELARRLSDVLSRVRYQNEEFVVERGGDPVAAIVPIGPKSDLTFVEFLRLLKTTTRPDAGFADDLERIQAAQPPAVEELPEWPS
jgi:prevent-host-death family protein